MTSSIHVLHLPQTIMTTYIQDTPEYDKTHFEDRFKKGRT
jgi:hypothetical protein